MDIIREIQTPLNEKNQQKMNDDSLIENNK